MPTERDWLFFEDPDILAQILAVDDDDEPDLPCSGLEEALQRQFSKFFLDFDYSAMAGNLIFDQAHALSEIFAKKDVLRKLYTIRAKVRVIGNSFSDLPSPIHDAIGAEALARSGLMKSDGTFDDTIGDRQEKIHHSPSWQAMVALDELVKRADDIISLLDAAIATAQSGTPLGKKAVEAWRLVDACVSLCERHPHTISVPKSINEAGPFHRFLCDMFQCFGIEEQPREIFLSWRKHVGR